MVVQCKRNYATLVTLNKQSVILSSFPLSPTNDDKLFSVLTLAMCNAGVKDAEVLRTVNVTHYGQSIV